jgi:hypothetical protein
MIIRHSHIRAFPLLINFPVLFFVSGRTNAFKAWAFDATEFMGRAGYLIWGITLPWIIGVTILRRTVEFRGKFEAIHLHPCTVAKARSMKLKLGENTRQVRRYYSRPHQMVELKKQGYGRAI